eukprot:gb/GECG01007470.1/.p1 GENE.gb/GECG01007470.1/~~gb/GECG01007470.1/.p1  ORF type:complete len:132 (+),score=14.80 gb/GECG01007470.1/:1-396(+)
MNADNESAEEEEAEVDVDSISDSEFFQQYRQQRMHELRQASRLPQYGSVIEVDDPNKLLDEINNASYATPVVVHLWEDYEPKCRALNQCLTEAAAKLSHVKVCWHLISLVTSTKVIVVFLCFPSLYVYALA